MQTPLIKKTHQQGIALLTVMIITTMTAIIATKITTGQNRASQRTVRLINSDQGILNIWSIENFIKIPLVKDLRKSAADFPGEDWTFGAAIPVDGGSIIGKITPENAKYNINNILDEKGNVRVAEANMLLRLLRNLSIDNPEEVISCIIDWMDRDDIIYRAIEPYRGAEDAHYTIQDPPYRTANQPLLDITELKLVKGITPAVYRKIEGFLTAIPEYVAVNVNFAKSEVISMLDDKIHPDSVAEILKRQNKQKAFRSYEQVINEIISRSEDNKISERLTNKILTTKTQYFRLNATVNLEGSITNASTLFKREENNVRVIWRNFGLWK